MSTIKFLSKRTKSIGSHSLILLEMKCQPTDRLRNIVRQHYVAPEITAKRLAELGAPQTAALLREHLPKNKKTRSGELGEIIATEVAEDHLAYKIPVRRLRWKDGREMALRGDDIIGLLSIEKTKIQFLKGESKSRIQLASAVINEAADALDRDKGRPTRHSVLFVAMRLRERGNDDLAKELEKAVLQGFRGYKVEHLLFTLTGSDPEDLLTEHLDKCKNKLNRHVVGVRVKKHEYFVNELFRGL